MGNHMTCLLWGYRGCGLQSGASAHASGMKHFADDGPATLRSIMELLASTPPLMAAAPAFTLVIGKHYADTAAPSKRAFPNALRDRAVVEALEREGGVPVLTLSLDDERDVVAGRHRCANVLRPRSVRALAEPSPDGWPGLRAVRAVYLDYLASVPQYILTSTRFGDTLATLADLLPRGATIVLPTHVSADRMLDALPHWCRGTFACAPLAREGHPLWRATAAVGAPDLVSNSGNETFVQLTRL